MYAMTTFKRLRKDFYLKRMEARSVLARYSREECRFLNCQRNMSILDAKGAGRGLSRNDIYLYRSFQDQSAYYQVRMTNLASTLASYGSSFIELMEQIDMFSSVTERLDLLGGRCQELPGSSWSNATLCQLVTRFKAETASLSSGRPPILACLMALEGALIPAPVEQGQTIQFRSPSAVPLMSLRLVSSR